ncbi:hypothetical protein CANCADRAFT_2993 [Tortispora caseinolytica NRRL Y-17796]|uniref:CHORD domain-containing protein n=1 Tax=Tortispora caseinolytica NRRL Y-17796 TaxID=767744 RepID=A0A1E4THP6_9ASCO|nr:hypothetical protein CANCADRAFT_2993 [Tortispora caseinolytica NRRL Y-17796]
MTECSRPGCHKDVTSPDVCLYHSGAPVFHDAQKGWSCCKKRVLSFEEFMEIPGCQSSDTHSAEKKAPPVPVNTSGGASNDSAPVAVQPKLEQEPKPAADTPIPQPADPKKPVEPVILNDPDDAVIPDKAMCKRRGCGKVYEGSRDGCVFHPGVPVFHDAAKGWSCCKKRVLEFDAFLKIPGCAKGKHLFVTDPDAKPADSAEAKNVECRVDFYQTPSKIHVTVFARNADKEKSSITFTDTTASFDIKFVDSDAQFSNSIVLFGPITPDSCTYNFTPNKVDITLTKANGISWSGLRKGETGAGMIRFGVGGRTGTVGAKSYVYNEQG